MKIKDIEGSIDELYVEISEDVFKKNSYSGLKTNKVYIRYWWIEGLLWVAENPENARIYPIFINDMPEVLEWKVINRK